MKIFSKNLMTLLLCLFLFLGTLTLTVSAAEITASGDISDTLLHWSLDSDGALFITGAGSMPDAAAMENLPWHSYRSQITSVYIEEGVTGVGAYAFSECAMLKYAILPASIVQIGEQAFGNCTGLQLIQFLGLTPEMADNCMIGVDTVCYYPHGTDSWTLNDLQPYGGNLNWIPAEQKIHGTCGEKLYWLMTWDSEVIIFGYGEMTQFPTANDAPWYVEKDRIRIVDVKPGVTSISSHAFQGCGMLVGVELPVGTAVKKLAFEGCSLLESVLLPDALTAEENAFYGCPKLTTAGPAGGNYNVQFGIADTTLPPNFLKWCTTIEELVLPEGMLRIEMDAFRNYTALREIVISEGVESIIGNAFWGCTGLTTVHFPDSLTLIDNSAFYQCTSLKAAALPGKLESIDDSAFEECTSLASVNIPASVTSIGPYSFRGCSALTSVAIPANAQVGDGAFFGCTALKSVVIPDILNISGKQVFFGCPLKTAGPIGGKYDVQFGTSSIYLGADFFDWCPSIEEFTLPEGIEDVGEAFKDDKAPVKKIILPNSMTGMGKNAFQNCVNLTAITIPEKVSYLQDMAFFGCGSLKTVELPDNLGCIYGGVFDGCTSLENIELPESLASIGMSAFHACESLKSIRIPNNVTTIGQSAFANCTSLTDVTLSTGICNLPFSLFYNCSSLVNITLPDGILTMEDQVFGSCSSLKEISIPKWVSNIPGHTFNGCANLEKVNFLGDIYGIGEWAFASCGVKELYLKETMTYFGPESLSNCNATLFCYQGSYVETYAKSNNKTYCAAPSGEELGHSFAAGKCAWCGVADASHTHSFGEWYPVKEAGCTMSGMENRQCPLCGAVEERTTDALGHSWDEGVVTAEPTETNEGIRTYSCQRCSETKTEPIPVLDHVHKYTDTVTAPTCTEQGYTTHTCACGHSYVDNYVGCLTHFYDPMVVAPTCTQQGYTQHVCRRCGDSFVDSYVTAGHRYVNGVCQMCGVMDPGWTEPSEPTEHVHSYVKKETPPTCTAWGMIVYTCACGDSYSENGGMPLEHSWDAGMITISPTCTAEGVTTFICLLCGEKKTDPIPMVGHNWVKGFCTMCEQPGGPCDPFGPHTEDAGIVTTEPTCTKDGVLTITCILCGYSRTEPIDATGHSWNHGEVLQAPTETSLGIMQYTCALCGEQRTEVIPMLEPTDPPVDPTEHVHDYVKKETPPTCTAWGAIFYRCACGDSYDENGGMPLGHSYVNGRCTVCGEKDPDWTEPTEPEEIAASRLAGSNRFDTAFLVADQMKVNLGIEKFDSVIVASGTNFADALSGSYLAAVKKAPILLSFSTDAINNQVKEYIRGNLNPGGTVYILGGESAVPASMEKGLDGFNVKRLKGDDRFGTNLAILAEAGVGDKPILVCTGLSFADSLSASATELPILLVYKSLTEAQKAFLSTLNGNEIYVIGGESAVSEAMEKQLGEYAVTERVQGANRFETSIAIAERFFYKPETAVVAYAWNFPDGLCGGPLAVTLDAPLILTMDKYEARAAEYLRAQPLKSGTILGGEGLISEKTANILFQTK